MCVFICLFQYTPYDKPEECNLLGRWGRGSLFIVKKKKEDSRVRHRFVIALLWKEGNQKQLCNGGRVFFGEYDEGICLGDSTTCEHFKSPESFVR